LQGVLANLHILRRMEDYLQAIAGTDLPDDVVLQAEDALNINSD